MPHSTQHSDSLTPHTLQKAMQPTLRAGHSRHIHASRFHAAAFRLAPTLRQTEYNKPIERPIHALGANPNDVTAAANLLDLRHS
jgi:hypothetical protein